MLSYTVNALIAVGESRREWTAEKEGAKPRWSPC